MPTAFTVTRIEHEANELLMTKAKMLSEDLVKLAIAALEEIKA
jgi:hypothetical protein